MAEPLGITALAITVIQGGYKAYQAFKLTRSFGDDFRNLHRKLQGQMMLMRWGCYRLRQETVLKTNTISQKVGLQDQKDWIEHVDTLVANIKMNVDTCNKLAKAHLEHYEEPQPVAPNAKSSEQNEPSGSAHKGNRSPAPKKGTFRTFLQKINPARLFNSRTRDLSKTSKEPSKNITTDQSSQIVPLSSFDETAVAQQLEAQKQRAQAFQKNATLMSKLRWGHEDRQSFVESLDMIVNDVKELRLLIEDFIQLCKGLEGVKRGREYPQRAPERPPMDYFVKASPSSSSYDSDESRRSRHGRVKKLQPISTSIFQCQETFHQVHSDICRLLPEPQSDVLYVKIYFDYHRTWEEFRPYQGVNVRDDSLVFMFQVQDSTSGLKSRLVVVDTPVLQPTDREGFESENDLRRLLSQRLIKRPMLQDSFDFEEFGIEPNELPFVCIGSLKAEFPRTPRAPDKLLNLLGPSKDLDDVLIVGWKHNLVASSDKAYRVSSRDTLEAMSRSNFGGVIPDVNRTHTPSTAKNRPRRSKDLLSDTEKEQLKRPVLHHLYQNRHNPWTKTTTLKQLLGERRYCREEFAHTHLQLAMLLGMSYVNLGSKGEARIFRPEDVTYFRPEESQERDTHYDLVLSPFLRVRSRKLQQIGTGNGFPLGRREATLELGLLLFQIGSWTALDYSHSRGLSTLVRFALSNLADVVTHAGPGLAIIIVKCLAGQDRYAKFSLVVENSMLHQWPRYGTRDDYSSLKEVLQDPRGPRKRSTGRTPLNRFRSVLTGRRPMNEVLEIMTYVLIPLQKLLPDLDVTEKSRIEGVSSTVNVVEVRTRSLELPRVKSIEGEISGASSARGSSEIIERRARSNSTEILERRARSRSSTEKFDVTEWQSEVIENGKKGGLGVDAKQRGKPEYADRPRRRNQMPIIVRDVTKSRVYSNRVIGRDSEGKVIETVEF